MFASASALPSRNRPKPPEKSRLESSKSRFLFTVDHFAPADASAVVHGDPRGSSKRITDDILHGHVWKRDLCLVRLTFVLSPAQKAEPSSTFAVSRKGESVPETSWWSRERITGPCKRPERTASLNAKASSNRPMRSE